MNDASEFPREFDVRQCEGKAVRIEATEAEREALSRRFGIVRIDRLEADVELHRKDRVVEARGTMSADIVQPCAVSAEDLPVSVHEEIAIRFVPEARTYGPDEEVELSAEEFDELEYTGSHFDLGEAVAQTLGLAIDPFLTGPEADEARKRPELNGEGKENAFSALKNLKL
ncbi:uncharacterized metal-binding protein YceD (DUF177 family) [Novosphingobium chloroacetimidivorans]|uniref:Uncharacterized metal-binding protein YceD (DUF177 family) n=1 Tax=Novosphingobium chloroacetimidivorans TaxID=1428314 RepID=A0A7W7NYZ9_9SPHN|nr:DUF177 domain-containing protein [Novosphingobium chloroacetimidivorans]MBB4860692.1 uncharacterized metal-binding protein YceD (DUF177 family) [Novosphingobium chloroacetimidivorans]